MSRFWSNIKYRRKTIFWLIVLVVGIVICALRWNAWFHNEPERPYRVAPHPHNIIMTMGDNSHDRFFSWCTETLENSFIILDQDTIPATGKMVVSRAGQSAYYSACISGLTDGQHTYSVQSGELKSKPYSFIIHPDSTTHFILFGDIQATSDTSAFSQTLPLIDFSDIDFISYVGDIINTQTDEGWQRWFRNMNYLITAIPQEAAVGNHEWLKGPGKTLDPRWTSIFQNPKNGSHRQQGTSYYIDFPYMRYIVLDTQNQSLLSDFTINSAWLSQAIHDAGDKWTVVVMHHSIYSAAMRRSNPLIRFFFSRALKQADLVIAGHDHNYTRRTSNVIGEASSISKIVNLNQDTPQPAAPVFMVTNSADKYYVSDFSTKDQRIGTNRAFYEDIIATYDTLYVKTYLMPSIDLYDAFTIARSDRAVNVQDSLPQEILEIPERYSTKRKPYIRRARERMAARIQQQ